MYGPCGLFTLLIGYTSLPKLHSAFAFTNPLPSLPTLSLSSPAVLFSGHRFNLPSSSAALFHSIVSSAFSRREVSMVLKVSSLVTCAVVLQLLRGVHPAAVQIEDEEVKTNATMMDSPSVSLATPYEYNAAPSASVPPQARRSKDVPPGVDSDPDGLLVYETLDDVPTTRLLSRAHRMEKCYSSLNGPSCWTGYICGHRCDPVLLAVHSFCRMNDDLDGGVTWKRCQKARKFNRCFARVCFRRNAHATGPKPASYEDPLSVAIVRYSRPPPKYELKARKNRQSSTQSAIFK